MSTMSAIDNSSCRLNTLGPLCLWQCLGAHHQIAESQAKGKVEKNIATGKKSQAITHFHFLTSLDLITRHL